MKWEDFKDVAPALYRPEVAATVGSVLAFMRAPGDTKLAKAFNLLCGIFTAIFVFPYAIESSGVKTQSAAIAFSFILGLVGMNLVAKTLDWIGTLSVKDLWQFVTRVQAAFQGKSSDRVDGGDSK